MVDALGEVAHIRYVIVAAAPMRDPVVVDAHNADGRILLANARIAGHRVRHTLRIVVAVAHDALVELQPIVAVLGHAHFARVRVAAALRLPGLGQLRHTAAPIPIALDAQIALLARFAVDHVANLAAHLVRLISTQRIVARVARIARGQIDDAGIANRRIRIRIAHLALCRIGPALFLELCVLFLHATAADVLRTNVREALVVIDGADDRLVVRRCPNTIACRVARALDAPREASLSVAFAAFARFACVRVLAARVPLGRRQT